jgi:hypothetical protein
MRLLLPAHLLLKQNIKEANIMKVSFPTLEDLLHEAKGPVRVATVIKSRDAKTDKTRIPVTAFLVVVTTKLADSEIGEYVYQVGKELSCFRDRLGELQKKALDVEQQVRNQIESSGYKALTGRYVPDNAEPVLGEAPAEETYKSSRG